jgi:hypothetical protein
MSGYQLIFMGIASFVIVFGGAGLYEAVLIHQSFTCP